MGRPFPPPSSSFRRGDVTTNPALVVLVLSALFLAVALSEVVSGPTYRGAPCSPGDGAGEVARDHTALWVQYSTSTATTSSTGTIQSGCLIEGGALSIVIFSPSRSINVTVAEYTTAYAPLDVWHAPAYNGTPSAQNLTSPGYWSNTTVAYWGAPTWSNLSLPVTPYSFASTPIVPPSTAGAERHLYLSYDGASWTFWLVTPVSSLPVVGSIGGDYGSLAAWLLVLGVAAALAIGTGAAAMDDLLAPPRRRGAGLVVLLLGLVAAVVAGSYFLAPDAWAQHLGSGWSYLVLLMPEYWALTALVIFVWPTKAHLQGEYSDDGEVDEEKHDLVRLPARWVIRRPGLGRIAVPRGAVQALKRLALGEKAYIKINDRVLTPYPAVVAVDGVVSSLVVLSGDVKETYPHAEFFSRDPLPAGVPKVDVEGHENRGRLRLVRWVRGELARPVLSEGGTKAVLDRLAERREVGEIADDVTSLEDEIVEARSETHVGAARRGRKLLRDYLAAAREGVADAKPAEGEKAVSQADAATGTPAAPTVPSKEER